MEGGRDREKLLVVGIQSRSRGQERNCKAARLFIGKPRNCRFAGSVPTTLIPVKQVALPYC